MPTLDKKTLDKHKLDNYSLDKYKLDAYRIDGLSTGIIGYTSDLCTGGTASASTSGFGAASNAFDDNTATYWGSNNTITTGWVEYQFASPKQIQKYTLVNNIGGSVPKDWTFEVYNGSIWVVLDTQTSQNPTTLTAYTFINAISYTRYRINISTVNSNTAIVINEIEMMEAIYG